MKQIILWLSIIFCLFALAGCGREEAENGDSGTPGGIGFPERIEAPEEIVLTGEYIPVAEFVRIPPINWDRWGGYIYKDDEIFCLGESGYELLAYTVNGSDTPRVVAATGSEDSWIRHFFIDEEDNLYLYEADSIAQNEFITYLRKIDADGQEIYRIDITGNKERVDWIYADGEGNVALVNTYAWELYFFDREGRYQGKDAVTGIEPGLHMQHAYGMTDHIPREHSIVNNMVLIGEQYFLWRVNEGECSISFWEVDFGECHISEEKVVDMASLGGRNYQGGIVDTFEFVLFDGEGLGPLISTKEVLWQYDMETGVPTELLRWDDKYIGIDGRYVKQINVGEAGEGRVAMEVFVYDDLAINPYGYEIPEALIISYVDKAYIKESQVVRIGLSNASDDIEQTIRRFNRLNNGYEVVLADYDVAMLKDMLSYGKEIPDLLDITSIRTGWLEGKNLLEDLIPYFERSKVISKEDILPSVWEILEGDGGKLTSMAAGFKIRALTTAVDLPEGGWTYSQLLSLEEQFPGSLYMRQHTPSWIWSLISMTGVDEFIDWDMRKCNFDSKEFRNLIEEVKNLDYPVNQKLGSADDTLEMVMGRQILMQFSNYGSPYDYEQEQEQSGGRLKTISFPTMDGELAYIFSANQNFAIYGESPNKEGAWAFLEFLLSEEQQRWYGTNRDVFPVNVDAFEDYLGRPHNTYSNATASEETKDKLRYMASHLVLNQNAADEISSIINEELKAYFAGDKDVKKTAKTIQNRVQLYLDEM